MNIWTDEEEQEEEEEKEKDLIVCLHEFIKNHIKLKEQKITKEALIGMTEISKKYFFSIGKELELFAKHAKRQTINNDDLLLLLRNNKKLKNKIFSEN